jgi:hypothetical protein
VNPLDQNGERDDDRYVDHEYCVGVSPKEMPPCSDSRIDVGRTQSNPRPCLPKNSNSIERRSLTANFHFPKKAVPPEEAIGKSVSDPTNATTKPSFPQRSGTVRPVPSVGYDADGKEADVLWKVAQGWEAQNVSTQRNKNPDQVSRQRQREHLNDHHSMARKGEIILRTHRAISRSHSPSRIAEVEYQ